MIPTYKKLKIYSLVGDLPLLNIRLASLTSAQDILVYLRDLFILIMRQLLYSKKTVLSTAYLVSKHM